MCGSRKKTMKINLACLLVLILTPLSLVHADDAAKLRTLFGSTPESGGTLTIPPGDYALDGETTISIKSNTLIMAYGASFHFPKELGNRTRRVMFAGENVSNVRWFGGHFPGQVFDPAQPQNAWEPQANTRAILCGPPVEQAHALPAVGRFASEHCRRQLLVIAGEHNPLGTRQRNPTARLGALAGLVDHDQVKPPLVQ